jgi:protocatechuate 3,4-dioxygenase beta subunit
MNTRRTVVLGTLGVVTGGGFVWFKRNSILGWAARLNRNEALQLAPAPTLDGKLAVLTPEQVEGPFFVSAPHRRNVKEDRRGKDLHLRMQVVRFPGGAPVEGGIVEMWHCDVRWSWRAHASRRVLAAQRSVGRALNLRGFGMSCQWEKRV